MRLHLDQSQRRKIDRAVSDIILGVIQTDGAILLQASDRIMYVGHYEWLKLDGLAGVQRGFALIVRQGTVVAVFPVSRLNPVWMVAWSRMCWTT